jgi:NitT/TauT family transport system substrate-binding protein
MTKLASLAGVGLAATIALAACSSAPPPTPSPSPVPTPTPVPTPVPISVALPGAASARFAGFLAAADQGYYTDAKLNVTLQFGATDPGAISAIGVAPMTAALKARDGGANIANIAQLFQRSGQLEVSWSDIGINQPSDWKGRRLGILGQSDAVALFAAMRKANINPENPQDLTIVSQPAGVDPLISRGLDAIQVRTWEEYGQLLESTNPKTNALVQPAELSVVDMDKLGTGALEDGIWASGSWLAAPGNSAAATAFLQATFKGWIYCRDNFNACLAIVMKKGSGLAKGHQSWQLNEVNKLIWPSPNGIGALDGPTYTRTIEEATAAKLITKAPDSAATRADLAQAAVAALTGDTKGTSFQPQTITPTAGGK